VTEATPESFLYIRTHIPSDDGWCCFSHARNSSDDENSRIGNSVPLFFLFSEHLLDLGIILKHRSALRDERSGAQASASVQRIVLKAGRLISSDTHYSKIQIGCNIHQLT